VYRSGRTILRVMRSLADSLFPKLAGGGREERRTRAEEINGRETRADGDRSLLDTNISSLSLFSSSSLGLPSRRLLLLLLLRRPPRYIRAVIITPLVYSFDRVSSESAILAVVIMYIAKSEMRHDTYLCL